MRAPKLIWLTAALIAGILVAPVLPLLPFWFFLLLSVIAIGGGLVAIRYQPAWLYCFLLPVFLWGVYHAQERGRPAPDDVSHHAGTYLQFTGTVAAEPERTSSGSLRYPLRVRRVEDTTPVSGLLLVTQTEKVSTEPHLGDTVSVQGTAELPEGATNPEGFDYRAYLKRKSIFAILRVRHDQNLAIVTAADSNSPRAVAARLHRALLSSVARSPLSSEEKALFAGILLSEREGIPADITNAFERTGAVHILSVSGLHLAVFAMVLSYIGRLLPASRKLRHLSSVVAIVCVWLFALAAGLSSATVRSAVMITVLLFAPIVRRDAQPLHSLVVAICAILLFDPLAVYDVGALFSVACVGGLIVWLGALQHVFIPFESDLPRWRLYRNGALLLVLSGFVAQVAALPLTAYHFSVVSLIAPIAGLVLVPLSEWLLVIGLFTTACFALLPLPVFFWAPTAWLIKLLVATTQAFAMPSVAAISVPAPVLGSVFAFYAVFFASGLVFRWLILRRTFLPESKPRLTLPQLVALPCLGLILLPLLIVVMPVMSLNITRRQANRVRVTFLDVGQGDAAVIETPEGRVVVVDGGGYPGQDERYGGDPGSRVVVPYLRRRGINTVDLLVPTHADEDHVQGLIAVARAFPVRQVLEGGVPDDGQGASARLRQRLQRNHVPGLVARRGEEIMLGRSGAVLEVLHPASELLTNTRSVTNANSIILRVRYKNASILLTGDAEEAAEASLLQSGATLQSDVLKVGHHGSRYSSRAAFLAAVQPKVAIISVGAENNFGHPAPDVLDKLKQVGATVYRTDLLGAVTVETDGDRLYVTSNTL